MRIWCSFTAKTGSIFTVILGISLCLFDELNVFACIIKEKHLLKLCSLSVCHMPNTSWGNTARRGEWNLLVPEASVHKHTQTHTQTDYCFFFSVLEHLGSLWRRAGKSRFPSTKTNFSILEDATHALCLSPCLINYPLFGLFNISYSWSNFLFGCSSDL